MDLIAEVRSNVPGLETREKLSEHKTAVLGSMDKRQTIRVKEATGIAGVKLFSREHNMICFLAGTPRYRRRGAATMHMDEALADQDRAIEITVSTFRTDDEKEMRQRHSMRDPILFRMGL